jgi:hypothetical protein
MTQDQAAQLIGAVVAAGTPLCVVRIALAVSTRHARSVEHPFVRPRTIGAVGAFTALVIPAVAALAVWLPPRSPWMVAIDLAAFSVLSIAALRAVHDIERASQPAREVLNPVRAATLRPRRVGEYVGAAWRVALSLVTVAGLAAFAWRLMVPAPQRRLLVPVSFALFSAVFLWLYEMWLRQVALAGETSEAGHADRRRHNAARRVFTVEVVLVGGFLVLAHALLDLDWQSHTIWGASGALAGAGLGVVGCALALSSTLAQREYRRA